MLPYMQIRDALAIALAAELGTYTYSNGSMVAAIAIETESSKLQEKAARDGLELLITPNIRTPITLAHGGLIQQVVGSVTLLQWDRAKAIGPEVSILLEIFQTDFPELTLAKIEHQLASEKLENRLESFSVEFSQEFLLN